MPNVNQLVDAGRQESEAKPNPKTEGSKPRGRPKSLTQTVNVQFKLSKKTAKKLRRKIKPYKRSQFAEVAISEALNQPQRKMKTPLACEPDSMET